MRLTFQDWLRNSLRVRGTVGTLLYAVRSGWEFLRDLTPARRRLRYGDLDYDWQHRVDTTWSNISLRTRLRELFAEGQYQATDPLLFSEIMSSLPIDPHQFTFLDFGSGKGRVLLMASQYPFRRIIGVELLPELHAIAEQNVRNYKQGGEARRIQLWQGDARQFAPPPEPLLVYLNNPFPEHVLREITTNLRRHPHKVVIVYANPVMEPVVAGLFRKISGTHQYSVFVP